MTSIARRVAGNTLWVLIQRVSAKGLSYILILYLARALGSLSFGKFVFANSFVNLFLILCDFGLVTLIIRELSRSKEAASQYLGNALVLKSVFSAVTFLIILLAVKIVNVAYDTRIIVYLMAVYVIVDSMGVFLGGVFQAYERMEFNTISQIAQKIFLVFLCFFLLSLGYGLIAVCVGYLLSAVFYCLVNLALVRGHFLKPYYETRWRLWKSLVREGFPIAAAAAIAMVYYNIDMIMLGKMKGDKVVGWYGAGYYLYFSVITFISAFLAAVFPVMSRLFKTEKEKMGRLYEKSVKAVSTITLPISVVGVLLAGKIILFLYGFQYSQSTGVFRLFSAVIFFGCLNGLASYFLVSMNLQNIVFKMVSLTTFVNVALNFILIPRFSLLGAALATVVCEILFFIISFNSIPKEFRNFSYMFILKAVSASLIMGFGIFLLSIKITNLAVLISAGIVIYWFMLFSTGYLNSDDRLILKDIFKRKV